MSGSGLADNYTLYVSVSVTTHLIKTDTLTLSSVAEWVIHGIEPWSNQTHDLIRPWRTTLLESGND